MLRNLTERFAIIVMKSVWKLMQSLPCLMGNGGAVEIKMGQRQVEKLPITC